MTYCRPIAHSAVRFIALVSVVGGLQSDEKTALAYDGSMLLLQIIILAVVQGLAELLPVCSSAHVIVAEKLMGLDPSSPPITLLPVMLHTGTMFAVIVYLWRQWRSRISRVPLRSRGLRDS
jgi:Bacitracin resistance protein BacA